MRVALRVARVRALSIDKVTALVAAHTEGRTLALLGESLHPGVTMIELDAIGDEYIESQGGYPTSKGYKGFPAAICISRSPISRKTSTSCISTATRPRLAR